MCPNKTLQRSKAYKADGQSTFPFLLASISETSDTMLTRPISPPASKRQKLSNSFNDFHTKNREGLEQGDSRIHSSTNAEGIQAVTRSISSPVQLSQVEGLPSANNVDTVSLKDIVGDPLIKECWVFNYLFDVDFLM